MTDKGRGDWLRMPMKNVVRLIARLDMTIDVDWDVDDWDVKPKDNRNLGELGILQTESTLEPSRTEYFV